MNSIEQKYNQLYASNLEREVWPNVTLSGWPTNRTQAILAAAGKGDTVLDVGCGNGYLLYQLRGRFSRLIGLEYSSLRLKQAQVNLEGLNFVPVHGSAEDMAAVHSASVDRIVSADTIEHIPDIYRAAAEMYRVLTPGGLLIVNTPNIAFIKKRLLLLCGRFPSTSQRNEGVGNDLLFDGGHVHYFTFRSLRLVLERAGFQVERTMGFGRLGYLHHLWPTLLSVGVQIVAKK